MQHVAITKNIEPVKREEMLRTLEPWALIKLTEVITTYYLQNNTVAKIAPYGEGFSLCAPARVFVRYYRYVLLRTLPNYR